MHLTVVGQCKFKHACRTINGASMAPKRATLPELIETGTEPEFFVTDICRAEMVTQDTARLYCCSKRGTVMRLEYTVVMALADLVSCCQKCLTMAREGDKFTFGDDGETH